MPQKVIAEQMSLESASDPIAVRATVETVPAEAVAVESYADRLMDELFEGVDRAFDGSGGLPSEPVQPEFVALKSISVPQIVLSQLAPPQPQRDEKDVEAIARQVALETAKKQQSKQSFDRILLGAACGSLLLVMGLWLASRSGLVRLPAAASAPETPAASGKKAPDTQFVEYVQRSLEAIEQKKAPQPNPQLAGVPGAPTPGTLPSIPISGAPPATAGLSTAVNRIANALEQAASQPGAPAPQVVVIPPPAQVTVAPAAPVAAAPAAPQTSAVSPSPAAPASGRAIAAAGTRSPLAASPSPSESPQPKILARETEPAPAPAAQQSAPAPEQSAPAVSSAPTSAHTLVGILELGDRSAALFEVDGVARRIYVGESIGASGWTLAEIKNQEAVIRKGGDVRSVFVGQKF
ncbi:hypothetical protein Osc7112_4282 [Oscillatoria nigro-viridis PCC 7112]|uniref:Type II secretion system protein GspC N-terminal domain-containing protein n=1 Tax=Phormidium nigroviride PCC 7112 TaxID=179408 RepID=K9VM47_9CYAN|nr:hypothetical protein [Oscillatoria nigro-viridis]AFZ08599.1 hypothetical protein Osc7112_4282 [Oscillatoria nigro-viridis PCC 7112]